VDLVPFIEDVLQIEVIVLLRHLESRQPVIGSARTPVLLAHLRRTNVPVSLGLLLDIPEVVGNHDLLEQREDQAG
jgi:hypothetical protein